MAPASLAITADAATAATIPAHDTPAKGIFGRFLDRLIAIRAAQAQRELARYSHIAKFPQSPNMLELFARD
jgi:hypothetical protein